DLARGTNPGDDWPCFLGPHRNNTSLEADIHLDWKARPPIIAWHTRLGESYGICSISRGRCFYLDRVGDMARLVCRHSETGKLLWTYEYPTNYEDLYGYNK